MQKTIHLRFGILCLMIVIVAFSRLIPHMPNFSPLGAIGLFGAAYFAHKWQAYLIPILATWVSDLFLNNMVYASYYPEFTWFYEGFYWQYGSYLLIVLMGIFLFKKVNIQRVVSGAFLASIIFFLVSNFGVWISGTMYPKTSEGLVACYVAAIPFFKGTLIGNLLFSAVLFGTFAFAQKQIPALSKKELA
jgi:hypothetical protein